MYNLLSIDPNNPQRSRRPYLERNLDTVLYAHKRALKRLKASRPELVLMEQQSTSAAPSSVGTRSFDWERLSKSDAADIVAAQTPVLYILPKTLRSASVNQSQQAVVSVDSPDWLPDPRFPRVKCRITCVVYASDDADSTEISTRTHQATISSEEQNGLEELSFRMEPFIVPVDQMPFQSKVNPGFLYRVKLSIECETSRDLELLMQLLKSHRGDVGGLAENLKVCVAWATLPHRSRESSLLVLHHSSDESRRLIPNLVVDIKWHQLVGSPLAIYLQAKTNAEGGNITSRHVPDHKRVRETCQVSYTLKGTSGQTKVITTTTLHCLFCRQRLPHSSFERLYFHYLVNHEHLHFAVKDSGRSRDTIYKSMEVELAKTPAKELTKPTKKLVKPKKQGKKESDDEDLVEHDWLRPARPFDLGSFLAGDHSWVDPQKPQQSQKSRELTAFTVPSSVVNARSKDPTKVGEVGSKKRKRYTVPDIPGVALYRNISKRRISPGEVLSESDDDVDCTWLRDQQRFRKIDDLSMSAERLVKLFDAHMDEEELNGDLYLPDALVRFCNRHKDELVGANLLDDFRAKLKQLSLNGLIPPTSTQYCLQLLESYIPTNASQLYTRAGKERQENRATETSNHEKTKSEGLSEDIVMVDNDSNMSGRKEIFGSSFGKANLEPLPESPVMQELIASGRAGDRDSFAKARHIMLEDVNAQRDMRVFEARLAEFVKRRARLPETPVSDESSKTASRAGGPSSTVLQNDTFMKSTKMIGSETQLKPMVGRSAACICGRIVIGGMGAIACASPVSCARDADRLCSANETADMSKRCFSYEVCRCASPRS